MCASLCVPPHLQFDNRRLSTDLKLHWQNHLHFGINHSSWTKEEDKQLLRLGKENDYRNWAAIATGLKVGMGRRRLGLH